MQSAVWAISGVNTTDLDEGENRIEIGVDDLSVAETVEKALTRLEISLKAVNIRVRDRLRSLSHSLTDRATGGYAAIWKVDME